MPGGVTSPPAATPEDPHPNAREGRVTEVCAPVDVNLKDALMS
jgi:hypothetical protein